MKFDHQKKEAILNMRVFMTKKAVLGVMHRKYPTRDSDATMFFAPSTTLSEIYDVTLDLPSKLTLDRAWFSPEAAAVMPSNGVVLGADFIANDGDIFDGRVEAGSSSQTEAPPREYSETM